jgi:acyl-ACP thioesterase
MVTPAGRRTFTDRRRVYLGDATPSGRLRLDAVVRYLQDVATDDTEDAHLAHDTGWVQRRMNLTIHRLPTIYEDVELTTWCSGIGGRWAERTTSLADKREVFSGLLVEAQAIWVHVRLETGSPIGLPDEFFAVYGDEVRKQKVSARLSHPGPSADAVRRAWPLRRVDFDVFGHVNNAVYWAAIEEKLDEWRHGRHLTGGEIEFRRGVDPGEEAEILVDAGDTTLWFWFVVGDEVRASARVDVASTRADPFAALLAVLRERLDIGSP